jgi:hypothetical protein
MMLINDGCRPCGKPRSLRFSSRRPREADFLCETGRGPWAGVSGALFPTVSRCALLLGAVHGWGPGLHRKSAPEWGLEQDGSEL